MGSNERIEVEGCDTIPKLFWHQVKARGERTAFREKDLGIWRATSWREYGERAKAAGMGLVKLGLSPARSCRSWPRPCPNGSTPTWARRRAGGVTNGIYPTDSAKQVEYILNDSRTRFLFVENEEQLDKFLEVRERCPDLVKVFVFDMEGLADFNDPHGHAVRRAAGARPRATTRPIPACGRSWSPARRPRSWRSWSTPRARPARPRARCCRTATSSSSSSNADAFIPIEQRRRAARLPAALPRRRAHLHRLPAAALRRHRQLRRERRDRAGEHARGGADHLLRRAAHLGALLFRHRHPHEGGDLDRPHRLQVGDRARPQGGRGRARRPQARADAEARPRASPTGWCWTTSSAPSACIACGSPAPARRRSRPT